MFAERASLRSSVRACSPSAPLCGRVGALGEHALPFRVTLHLKRWNAIRTPYLLSAACCPLPALWDEMQFARPTCCLLPAVRCLLSGMECNSHALPAVCCLLSAACSLG